MSEQPKIVSIPEVELDAKDARIAELEAECARLRAVLRAMVQQSVDMENEGVPEEEWFDAATFLDEHTLKWTPDVHGEVLKSVVAALAASPDPKEPSE